MKHNLNNNSIKISGEKTGEDLHNLGPDKGFLQLP